MFILAGTTLRDRLQASLGALTGIALTGILSALLLGHANSLVLPLLIAPMGAAAVLVFAVPASPLAQPWPVVGGNIISAIAGIATAKLIPDPALAAGIAVAAAIALMSLTRSLHPPGGAVALLCVLGGPSVSAAGFFFAFIPVGLNCLLLVSFGIIYHSLVSNHSYPHKPAPLAANTHRTADLPAPLRAGFRPEDIDAALAESGESFDISRDDLDRLLRRVESHAAAHAHAHLTCADIMSRDVIQAQETTTPDAARALLLNHDVRTLPVTDATGLVTGAIGLRELSRNPAGTLISLMTPAITASPNQPASDLIAPLTDGSTRAVIITSPTGRAQGIVTQTDLLAALARPHPAP
ncbi:membrane protein [Acidocella aquatica]|uniref:Membrane protein n=1 Tax=Acidocella aquatica TaxID=1922313 RepID=A0ABQ6A588_9PROT|nr:HPP family protein [Acidocella aquatica]GLR67630.1 membrane protein [Acidocella aquatica]